MSAEKVFIKRPISRRRSCIFPFCPTALHDFNWLEESTNHIAQDDQLPFILGVGKSLEDNGGSFKDCLKVLLVEATLQKPRYGYGGWANSDAVQKMEVKSMMDEWEKNPNEGVRSVA